MTMKDLILCMAILLSSFIVKGQSSDESAVLTYKVITMQEIGGGNVSPKQKVYKNKYVVVTPKLFVVSNTKNNWDAVTSETVAKVIDVNFNEELGTLMIQAKDIRDNSPYGIVHFIEKNVFYIQNLNKTNAIAYDVERVETEF